MEQVKTYFEAIKLLECNKILVFKNAKKFNYLSLNSKGKIAFFNENLKYNISYEDLNELMKENKIFTFDGNEDIEI